MMADNIHSQGPTISAEKARQGEIILKTRTQRILFFGGLIGAIVLAFLMQFVHVS
jgi:hypothetical protein